MSGVRSHFGSSATLDVPLLPELHCFSSASKLSRAMGPPCPFKQSRKYRAYKNAQNARRQTDRDKTKAEKRKVAESSALKRLRRQLSVTQAALAAKNKKEEDAVRRGNKHYRDLAARSADLGKLKKYCAELKARYEKDKALWRKALATERATTQSSDKATEQRQTVLRNANSALGTALDKQRKGKEQAEAAVRAWEEWCESRRSPKKRPRKHRFSSLRADAVECYPW